MRFIGAISLISLAAGSLEQSEQEPDADSLLQHAAFFKDDEDCGSEKCQPHTDPEPPKPPIKPPVKPVTTPAPFVNTPPPITRPPVTQPPKKDCENFFGRGAASLDQIISIVDPDVPALFCDLFNQKAPCTFIHRAQASGDSNCVSPTPPDKCHKYIKVAYSKCDGLEAIKAGTVDVTGIFDPQTGVFKGCEGNVTSTDYTYWAPNNPISDKPPPTFPDTYKAIKCSQEEPTRPPVTLPPVTRPPVTRPPVTRPPVTRPPVTRPPVTQAPVTRPPVTQPPPITRPPVTQPPVTQPPVTRPPVTRPPVDNDQHDGKKGKKGIDSDQHDGKKGKKGTDSDQHDGKKGKHGTDQDHHDGKKGKKGKL